MDEVTVRERLPKLARTMTQAGAARELGISRERVRQIAEEDKLEFLRREALVTCSVCGREQAGGACLRCKWTTEAIRALRMRLQLTQDEFAFHLGVGSATMSRWENGQAPGPTGLEKLEKADGKLTQSNA